MFNKIHSLLQLHANIFKPFETLAMNFFIRLSIRHQNLATDNAVDYWFRKWTVAGWRSIIYLYTLTLTPHQDRFYKNVWKTGKPILRAYCFSGLLIVLLRTSPLAVSFYIRMSQIRIYIYISLPRRFVFILNIYIKRHVHKHLHGTNWFYSSKIFKCIKPYS